LAFCVTKEHATYMAEKFCLVGIKSAVLTSDNSKDRLDLRKQLSNGKNKRERREKRKSVRRKIESSS